jgi:SAM-dependent methyltransferase
MSISTPINSCRLCDGNKLSPILTLAPTPPGDHYLPQSRNPEKLPVFPLSLQQCVDCGHVQLGAVVDPAYIYREYIYTTKSSLGLADHFAEYAASTINKLSLRPGSFVVEIGSNDGTMLNAFQMRGMKVLGVDPAREIAQQATSTGTPTLAEFFSGEIAKKIATEYGQADLIVANNVIANVADMRATFTAVRELLSPDGVFVFETGYLKYLAEGHVFDNIYHEHIDYHSIRPLMRFFDSISMQLFDVVESTSKGNSIRCFVEHAKKGRKISKAVDDLVEREIGLGYQTPAPYERLGNLLQQTKNKLHAFLEEQTAQGATIAGFGASVGVTTVLYEFDLGKYVKTILDDNPARDGLFSPGLGIPVLLAERELENNPPDIVILLAWRYSESILRKHKDGQHRRTRFLNFFPQVEVF